MKLKLKIILILAGVFLASNISASALKITPSSVYLESTLEKTGQKVIIIENPGKNVALFEVFPDDFSDWISVFPASFTLNPGEKKEVSISVNPEKEGIYATSLSVVSKPLSEKGFQANAGVKIPLEIRVSEKKLGFWPASILDGFKKIFESPRELVYILGIALVLIFAGIIKKIWRKIFT